MVSLSIHGKICLRPSDTRAYCRKQDKTQSETSLLYVDGYIVHASGHTFGIISNVSHYGYTERIIRPIGYYIEIYANL